MDGIEWHFCFSLTPITILKYTSYSYILHSAQVLDELVHIQNFPEKKNTTRCDMPAMQKRKLPLIPNLYDELNKISDYPIIPKNQLYQGLLFKKLS